MEFWGCLGKKGITCASLVIPTASFCQQMSSIVCAWGTATHTSLAFGSALGRLRRMLFQTRCTELYPVQALCHDKPLLSFSGLGENCDILWLSTCHFLSLDSIVIDSIDIVVVVVDYHDVVIVPSSSKFRDGQLAFFSQVQENRALRHIVQAWARCAVNSVPID